MCVAEMRRKGKRDKTQCSSRSSYELTCLFVEEEEEEKRGGRNRKFKYRKEKKRKKGGTMQRL